MKLRNYPVPSLCLTEGFLRGRGDGVAAEKRS